MGKPFKPLFFLTIALLFAALTGQTQFLPVNEAGKCEMNEVVIAEGFPKRTLLTNQLKWLKRLGRVDGKLSSVINDTIAGKTSGNFEFLVYAQSGILRKIAGAISYHIDVEAKDGKYRYTFSDFVFHYFAQDRNYRIVKTGNTKPLEETRAPGWQKSWTDHRKSVYGQVSKQIEELKVKIIQTSRQVDVRPEIKVDW